MASLPWIKLGKTKQKKGKQTQETSSTNARQERDQLINEAPIQQGGPRELDKSMNRRRSSSSHVDLWLQEGDRLLYEAIETHYEPWIIDRDCKINPQPNRKMDKLKFANQLEEAKNMLSRSISLCVEEESFARGRAQYRQTTQEVLVGKILLSRAYMETEDIDMALSFIDQDGITAEELVGMFSEEYVPDYIRRRAIMFAAMKIFIEILVSEKRHSHDVNLWKALENEVNRLEEFFVNHVSFEEISHHFISRKSYDSSIFYWLEEILVEIGFLRFKYHSVKEAVNGWRRYLILFPGQASFRKPNVLRTLSDVLSFYISDSDYVTVIDSIPDQWKFDSQIFIPKTRSEEIQLLTILEGIYVPSNLPLKISTNLTHLPNAYERAFSTLMLYQNYTTVGELAINAMKKGYGNSEEFNKYYMMNFFIMGKYREAFILYESLIAQDLQDPFVYLIASLCCLDKLEQPDKAIEIAMKGVVLESLLKPRFLEIIGRAYGQLSRDTTDKQDSEDFSKLSIENLLMACDIDDRDSNLWFQLAIHYAFIRDISKALKFVRKSLALNAKNVESLHLLALLYTSERDFSKALLAINIALRYCPQDLNLLTTMAAIYEGMNEWNSSLENFQKFFHFWRAKYGNVGSESVTKFSGVYEKNSDQQSNMQMEIEEFLVHSLSHMETGDQMKSKFHSREPLTKDIDPLSLAWSPLEYYSSPVAVLGREEAILLLVDAWLHCCRLYLQLEDFENAFSCLREALQFGSVSANLCYHFGLFYEQQNQLDRSMVWYNRALTTYPHHAKTHVRLGMIHVGQAKTRASEEQQDHQQLTTLKIQSDDTTDLPELNTEKSAVSYSKVLPYGSESSIEWAMAEMHLQTASRHDPQNPDPWYGLGILLKHRYQSQCSSYSANDLDESILARSTGCLTHALSLEKTRPVRPFLVADLRITRNPSRV